MSTKIYNGMAVPLNKFSDFINLFYDISILKAKKHIAKQLKLANESSKKVLKKEYDIDCPLELAKHALVMKRIIESSKKGYSDSNYDMWFNAWIIKSKVYLYAPCDRIAPTYKNFPSWCKDFSYWDNTDPDENITNREWNKREKIWNKIFDYGKIERQKISFVAIEAKDVMHRGIFALFSQIPKEKLYSLHMAVFWAEKKR